MNGFPSEEDREREKRNAAEAAAELVQPGMLVGLGTGSTAVYAIRKLGEKFNQGLKFKGIPSSGRTAELAASYRIPLVGLDSFKSVDLTIDGADEIDSKWNLIKGGGGALTREKILAFSSKRLIIAADSAKKVAMLGKFPLPIEVVPFGSLATLDCIRKRFGVPCQLRSIRDSNELFLTDQGNCIVDCSFDVIHHPGDLADQLDGITGVVEHGLFVGLAPLIFVGVGKTVEKLSSDPE